MSTKATAEQQQLLDTKFSPEIEKIAEAQLASEGAVENLKAYGASLAEEMLMSYMPESDELQKTASENKDAIVEKVETALNTVGAHAYDQEAELTEEQLGEVLHKEAQAAAHIIADGFFGEIESANLENPELVKEAAKNGFMKKTIAAAGKYAKKGAAAAGAHVKKHAPKYGAAAAGAAAGAGAMAAAKKK